MRRGARRRGREAALQLLYQAELVGESSPSGRDLYWENLAAGASQPEREFAEWIVDRVIERRDELDVLIDQASEHWDLARLSRVDLCLMRLAACELLCSPEVPGRVIVNEAIEIARDFSDAKAAAFINGVLDRIARERGRIEEA